jgi:tetratricopeptide (TPR) repeat protein
VPDLLAILGRRNAVWRASAARLLAAFPTTTGVTDALVRAASDADALVRTAATWALGQRGAHAPEIRTALERALSDDVRAVRLHAALALREVRPASLAPATAQALEAATAEWRASQLLGADTPEAHYNLGIFHAARGELDAAVGAYEQALRLWPRSIQVGHNLGMLHAQRGDLAAAEKAFRGVVAVDPVPQTLFALGLLHAQQGRWADAVAALERCVAEDPAYPRARYNLALAYAKAGDSTRALDTLEAAAELPDTRREAILTLVDLARQVRDRPRLERWVLEAAKLDPAVAEDEQLRELMGP